MTNIYKKYFIYSECLYIVHNDESESSKSTAKQAVRYERALKEIIMSAKAGIQQRNVKKQVIPFDKFNSHFCMPAFAGMTVVSTCQLPSRIRRSLL